MKQLLPLFFLLVYAAASSQYRKEAPLAHTYSIVAYDPETGEMGVAVQSHWFSVGTVVTWAEAGVGAIATQSFSNPAFGPQGLALLKTGLNAQQTLNTLLQTDDGREYRQVGIVDASGMTAAHSGAKNIEAAGHQVGKHFAVQANLMANDQVWPAMAAAFEQAKGPLAERMIMALEAAQEAGGDIRGTQSAAVLVVSGNASERPWMDRKVDLRVDDHHNPIEEIRRLWKVHQAYEFMNAGDVALEKGDFEKAGQLYKEAQRMFPENLEMQFWHAINLANTGKVSEALPIFKTVFTRDSNWRELTPRLIKNGVLTVSEDELKKILDQ